ncbi:hypothetical protein AB4212_23845 [Streptomyces sp. 2MCAF27]
MALDENRLPCALHERGVVECKTSRVDEDEFAFRKGCTYGTLLVDVEAGRVADVLRDRTSKTLAAWPTAHLDAEIICRDWATCACAARKVIAAGERGAVSSLGSCLA